jgi:hypothetical protein
MDVYNHFSCYTLLPIHLNDVRDHVLEAGVVSSLQFVEAPLKPGVVHGFLRVFKWRKNHGPDGKHAQIFHARGLSTEWRRVVVTKEMLHILDKDEETASTRDGVDQLISHICGPFMLTGASLPGLSDNFAILRALAILLPRDALHILRPLHQKGQLTQETIAQMAQIPVEWMEFLLSYSWEAVLEQIHKASK